MISSATITQAQALLPVWVTWGPALFFYPGFLLFSILSFACVRSQTIKPFSRAKNEVWTERARLLYPARLAEALFLIATVFLSVGLCLVMQSPIQKISADTLLLLLIGTFFFVFQIWRSQNEKALLPPTPQNRFYKIVIFHLWQILPLALMWPAIQVLFFSSHFGFWYGVCFFVVLLFLLWKTWFGFVQTRKWSGLLHAPNAKLTSALAPALAKAKIQPHRIYMLESNQANAWALPHNKTLLFTTALVHHFSENEIAHIALHELGHLAESPKNYAKRFLRILLLVPILLMGFLTDVFGQNALLVILGYFVFAIFGLRFIQKSTRNLEEQADKVASQNETDKGAYAQALEKIYEFNLMPAVIGKGQTHPDLYDRLIASGITPAYPRPTPPSRLLYRKNFLLFWFTPALGLASSLYFWPTTARVALHSSPNNIISYGLEQYSAKNFATAARFLAAGTWLSQDGEIYAPLYAGYAYAQSHQCDSARQMYAVAYERYQRDSEEYGPDEFTAKDLSNLEAWVSPDFCTENEKP